MLAAYAFILLLTLAAVALGVVTLLASSVLRPAVPYDEKLATYECGIDAVGSVESRINIRFYIYALIFVIFDVEALYILPWAVGAKAIGPFALLEMLIFLSILFIGLLYAWRKGALVWE